MAGALIPLIAGMAPDLLKLIVGLVHTKAPAVEQQLGPGTGPVKFAAVFADVLGALGTAASAGVIDKTLPSDEKIKTIIQSVVTSMQLSGVLGTGSAAAAVIGTGLGTISSMGTPQPTITLSPGQILTVSVR